MAKILFINNGYPSKEKPHYCTYIASMVECLRAANFDVSLITLEPFTNLFEKVKSYLSFNLKLLLFKNFKDYDYIYCNHFQYYFILFPFNRKSIKKFIIHFHGGEIKSTSIFKECLNRVSYHFLPRNNAQYIVPSRFFAKQVSTKLNYPINKLLISPSGGVNTNLFKHVETLRSKEIFCIGFAGPLTYLEGADFITKLSFDIEELAQLNKTTIKICFISHGKGKEKYIAKMAKDNIIVINPMDKREMFKFYNAINLLVMPTRAESLGLVALESLFCNIPVLAPRDFSFPEFILDGYNGELFEPNNYLDFKCKVAMMINKSYTIDLNLISNYSTSGVIDFYKKVL